MFRHDSPYYAPLSSSAWYLYTGIRFTLFRILQWVANRCNMRYSIQQRVFDLWSTYREQASRGIGKEFEEAARRAPPEIDGRALMWTYETLDEDHELEQFFSGIPGFCSSKVIDNPQSSLDTLRSWTVASGLSGFLERTWSSNLVSETIKIRRLVICVRAVDAAHLSDAANEIFYRIFLLRPALLESVELGHALISRGDGRKTEMFAQSIIAYIIENVPQRNERWFSLTMHHLGISEHVLRGYLDHGDSVLLANLIHFTHQFIRNFLETRWKEFPLSYIFQRLGSYYNVQDTPPELQHDFCGLWNEIVLQRRDRDHFLLSYILGKIRPIYVALHQDSTLYDEHQLCSIPGHRIGTASNLNDVGSRTAETARVPITASPALHYHGALPSDIPPVTEYTLPPSPTPNPDLPMPQSVDEQSRTVLLGNITPVASSFHLAPLENDRIRDGTAADPIQGTTYPPAISSVVNTSFSSTSSHGTASRPTRNITTTTSSFVPNTVPSPIPLLRASTDPVLAHISADPTANESGGPPDNEPVSLSSFRLFAASPLAPQEISSFDTNAATEIGPLDEPGDTLDPNHRVMSRSFTPPSSGVADYGLRAEDGGPAETSAPSQ